MIPEAWLRYIFPICLRPLQPVMPEVTNREAPCAPDWQTKGSWVEQEEVCHFPSALMAPQLWAEASEGSQLVKWAKLDESPPRDHAQDATPAIYIPIQHEALLALFRSVSRDTSWASWRGARSVYLCLQYFWALSQLLALDMR